MTPHTFKPLITNTETGKSYDETQLAELLKDEGVLCDGGKLIRDCGMWAVEYSFLQPPLYLDPSRFSVTDANSMPIEKAKAILQEIDNMLKRYTLYDGVYYLNSTEAIQRIATKHGIQL